MVNVAPGLHGAHALVDIEHAQEPAHLVHHVQHQKVSSAGTVQQALTQTVLDAVSLLKVLISVAADLDIRLHVIKAATLHAVHHVLAIRHNQIYVEPGVLGEHVLVVNKQEQEPVHLDLHVLQLKLNHVQQHGTAQQVCMEYVVVQQVLAAQTQVDLVLDTQPHAAQQIIQHVQIHVHL